MPLVIPERYDWAGKQTAIEKANQKRFAFPLLLLYNRMGGPICKRTALTGTLLRANQLAHGRYVQASPTRF